MKVLERIASLIARISKGIASVAMVAIGVLILLILTEISLRTFLNFSLGFTIVVSGWLLICIAFMGFAWTLKSEGHIRLEIVTSHFSQRVRQWILLCIATLSMLVMILICVWSWQELICQYELHSTSTSAIRLPMWWAWTPLCIGLIFFVLQLAGVILESVLAIKKLGEGH